MSSNSRITADRALADYVAMGPQRSLKKLAQHYTEARTENGTVGNLRYWSRTRGWVRAAQEHDAQVAGEVSRKAIEAQAEATWDEAAELMDTARVASDRLKACLPSLEVADASAAKAMADVVATLAKLATELERGQATTAEARQGAGNSAEIIYDLLEKRRKEREGDQ